MIQYTIKDTEIHKGITKIHGQVAHGIYVLVENDSNTRIEYWKNGERHRDNDQPAVIWVNGTKEWYQHGKRHRDNDKPAIVRADGSKEWYQNGEHHRDNDQPAVIRIDGTKWW